MQAFHPEINIPLSVLQMAQEQQEQYMQTV